MSQPTPCSWLKCVGARAYSRSKARRARRSALRSLKSPLACGFVAVLASSRTSSDAVVTHEGASGASGGTLPPCATQNMSLRTVHFLTEALAGGYAYLTRPIRHGTLVSLVAKPCTMSPRNWANRGGSSRNVGWGTQHVESHSKYLASTALCVCACMSETSALGFKLFQLSSRRLVKMARQQTPCLGSPMSSQERGPTRECRPGRIVPFLDMAVKKGAKTRPQFTYPQQHATGSESVPRLKGTSPPALGLLLGRAAAATFRGKTPRAPLISTWTSVVLRTPRQARCR